MKEVTMINEQEVLGKKFRIYGDVDNPLFLAKDVAEWIDYDKSSINKMLSKVEDDEKVRNIVPTLGGNQESWLLTEDGLYEVLMQSRKTIAKQFKKKVKQILKDIRRDGGYIATNEDDDEEMILAKAFVVAQKKIERQKEELAQAHKKIEEDAPKVTFAETVIKSDKSIGVGDLAKLISSEVVKIGRNRMFEQLRDWGFLMDGNSPYQRWVDMGLFETTMVIKNGFACMKTLVTPKGQMYIVNKIIKELSH